MDESIQRRQQSKRRECQIGSEHSSQQQSVEDCQGYCSGVLDNAWLEDPLDEAHRGLAQSYQYSPPLGEKPGECLCCYGTGARDAAEQGVTGWTSYVSSGKDAQQMVHGLSKLSEAGASPDEEDDTAEDEALEEEDDEVAEDEAEEDGEVSDEDGEEVSDEDGEEDSDEETEEAYAVHDRSSYSCGMSQGFLLFLFLLFLLLLVLTVRFASSGTKRPAGYGCSERCRCA